MPHDSDDSADLPVRQISVLDHKAQRKYERPPNRVGDNQKQKMTKFQKC